MTTDKTESIYNQALKMHACEPRGKLALHLTKPLNDQRDLALAYSPGVAAPCLEIEKDEENSYLYTSKGNEVAVISNGTAVLGLGNIGAAASKPVMEGKAALFKRFADIDACDIEVYTENAEDFIKSVSLIGKTWGGINLEDIKAPECFEIEQKLQSLLPIPVFHDDQHGTAIITLAGLINAADITERTLKEMKVVMSGAGAAAIACADLLRFMGISNIIMCDTIGVIYKGRKDGMNPWKEKHAANTEARTLGEALVGADVFIGVSARGVLSKEMVKEMAPRPIIFAMANPEPEITPMEVKEVRSDAIIATGRSDYPNQVNNVMCFPYIFRGALDVMATCVNMEMKIAAANAIASLARQNITEEVATAYSGKRHQYGTDYIIPVPFDSRLLPEVASAVAKAAIESGVARQIIEDLDFYKQKLYDRLNPGSRIIHKFYSRRATQKPTILFVEGEEEEMIVAAAEWHTYGQAILIGHEESIRQKMNSLGITEIGHIRIMNAASIQDLTPHVELLYKKQQRNGLLYRDCLRLIKRDRNVFASSLLAMGMADGMVTGLTRDYISSLNDIKLILGNSAHSSIFALSILVKHERTIFIADTAIHEKPTPEQLAEIAIQSAREVRRLGHDPKVALVSFANFGNYPYGSDRRISQAVNILNSEPRDFDYDGEMAADTALNGKLLQNYPFCKLQAPANVLVMPDLNSANIAAKLVQEFGIAKLVGPILCGMEKSVQIVPIGSSSNAVLESAMLAAIGNSS